LAISEVTVKMHRANAMRKLGARSVAKLGWMAEILNMPSLRGHEAERPELSKPAEGPPLARITKTLAKV
jgi:hypothetical protein